MGQFSRTSGRLILLLLFFSELVGWISRPRTGPGDGSTELYLPLLSRQVTLSGRGWIVDHGQQGNSHFSERKTTLSFFL